MTGDKKYTREEVINIIDELLQRPDLIIDATNNEHTEWNAESLLYMAESEMAKQINPNQLNLL